MLKRCHVFAIPITAVADLAQHVADLLFSYVVAMNHQPPAAWWCDSALRHAHWTATVVLFVEQTSNITVGRMEDRFLHSESIRVKPTHQAP